MFFAQGIIFYRKKPVEYALEISGISIIFQYGKWTPYIANTCIYRHTFICTYECVVNQILDYLVGVSQVILCCVTTVRELQTELMSYSVKYFQLLVRLNNTTTVLSVTARQHSRLMSKKVNILLSSLALISNCCDNYRTADAIIFVGSAKRPDSTMG